MLPVLEGHVQSSICHSTSPDITYSLFASTFTLCAQLLEVFELATLCPHSRCAVLLLGGPHLPHLARSADRADCLSAFLSLCLLDPACQPSKGLIPFFLLGPASPLISYFGWCTNPVGYQENPSPCPWSHSHCCEKVFKNWSLHKAASITN